MIAAVLPDGDDVSVAVYLSDAVQASLDSGSSLQDHCHAVEGISHFVLLLWSAVHDRSLRRRLRGRRRGGRRLHVDR